MTPHRRPRRGSRTSWLPRPRMHKRPVDPYPHAIDLDRLSSHDNDDQHPPETGPPEEEKQW